jgi:hypothetical protein
VGEDVLEGLAREYWRRVVRLADVRAHYRLEGDALVSASTAPPGLPRRLERVEVLVTTDVPCGEIRQL